MLSEIIYLGLPATSLLNKNELITTTSTIAILNVLR